MAYAPAVPTEVTATPDGTGAVEVSWSPPADDGGDPVTVYTVTWQQNVSGATAHSVTVGASRTSVVLPAGDFSPAAALYNVKVAASNAVGTGAATGTASPVAPVTTVSASVVVLSAA